MPEQLYSLVERCTVRLKLPHGKGTGFFVAPGLILTCAHVVEPAGGDKKKIKAIYNNKEYEITHIQSHNCYYPKQNYSYPDLALLTIGLKDHPCVYLYPNVATGDELYIYGYSGRYLSGEGTTVKYEAPARFNDQQWLLKLSQGQITPGFSGSPIVDMKTGGVCGVVKMTRDKRSDLGGGGVPTEVVLQVFAELQELQTEYHSKDSRWAEASKEFEKKGISQLFQPPQPKVHDRPAAVSPDFVDRKRELSEFRKAVKDPGKKMVCIVGGAGMGKTDILCKICREIEDGKLKLTQTGGEMGTDGIIYYNCRNEALGMERLLQDIGTMLGGPQAAQISMYRGNPEMRPEEKSLLVLDELINGTHLLILDNFEEYLSKDHTIEDDGFRAFMDTNLSTGHGMRVLASSREYFMPEKYTAISNIKLDKGLPTDEGVKLLYKLDSRYGEPAISNEPKELLERAVAECSGIPKALEGLIRYLKRTTNSLGGLLGDKKLFGEAVVKNLTILTWPEFNKEEKGVLQALAIYGKPVPERAVSFLLKPFCPHINVADVLKHLVAERSVGFLRAAEGLYYLHPMDQKCAALKIPETGADFETGEVYNPQACHKLAGKYWFSEAKKLEPSSGDSKERFEFKDYNTRKQWVECVDQGFQHLVEAEAWDVFIANNERMLRALDHKDGWGYIQETTATCEKVKELLPKIDDVVVSAKWLRSYTIFNIHLGNFVEAEKICKEGLDISRKAKQKDHEGEFLWRMAWICWGLGRIDEARECIEKSAQLKKEESEFAESRVCGFWSELDEMEGQLELALKKQEFALRLGRPESDYHTAQNDGRLLRTYRLLGNYDSASKCLDEGLKSARQNEYTRLLILILCEAGYLSIDLDKSKDASEYFSESYTTASERGYKFEMALSGYALGRFYHQQQGCIKEAREKYEEALSLGMALSSYKCAVMLGLLSLEEGRSDRAKTCLEQGIDYCNKLLENKTRTYDPMYYRALAQLALGKKEEALASYRDSLEVCSAAGVLKEKLLDLSLLEKARKDVAGLGEVTKLLRAAS